MAQIIDNVRVSEAFEHGHLLPELIFLLGLLGMQDLHGHKQPLPACLVHLDAQSPCFRWKRKLQEAPPGEGMCRPGAVAKVEHAAPITHGAVFSDR